MPVTKPKNSCFWWVVAVLVIADAILIGFCESDIARSWPWGAWPGTEWQINWAATLFWALLLSWLVLLISFEGILPTWIRVIWALAVWAVLGVLLTRYLASPWAAVVENKRVVKLLMAFSTLVIALCSASEAALLNGETVPIPGQSRMDANYTPRNRYSPLRIWDWAARKHSNFLIRLMTHDDLPNAIIVMANTVVAVGMTVVLGHYLRKTDSTDMFTIFGVSLVLFLFGEMVPKQMALNPKMNGTAVRIGRVWVVALCLTVVIYVLAAGIVDTFRYFFPRTVKSSPDS